MPSRWLLPLLLTLPVLPAAHAQVRRCQAPNGQVIYTDRPCDTVGGVEYRQPPRPHTVPTWTCARTVRDLVAEMQAAIDARDADALVRLYDWQGIDGDTGYRIAERLTTIAERPLVGIAPVMPALDPDGDEPALASERRPPAALRLQQLHGDSGDVASTVLGLHRRLGCWWIHF